MASGTTPLSQINNRHEALIPPRALSGDSCRITCRTYGSKPGTIAGSVVATTRIPSIIREQQSALFRREPCCGTDPPEATMKANAIPPGRPHGARAGRQIACAPSRLTRSPLPPAKQGSQSGTSVPPLGRHQASEDEVLPRASESGPVSYRVHRPANPKPIRPPPSLSNETLNPHRAKMHQARARRVDAGQVSVGTAPDTSEPIQTLQSEVLGS